MNVILLCCSSMRLRWACVVFTPLQHSFIAILYVARPPLCSHTHTCVKTHAVRWSRPLA